MTTITVDLPDERLSALQDKAAHLHVSTEDLIRVSIEELLEQPDEAFQSTVDFVLKKNAELYRRLA